MIILQGWRIPTTAAMQEVKNSEPHKEQKRNLRTYCIHAAREFLGEPVGQKREA
jgi:hypothetical protein